MTSNLLSQQLTILDQPIDALSMLKQLPGYVICMDREHKFNYFTNDHTAYTIGYDKAENVYGQKIEDIRCKAAECTDIFKEQNNLIFENRQTLKIIDIHPYRNDEVKSLLTYKFPLIDHNQNVVAVTMHANDISHTFLYKMAMILANNDKKFRSNNMNQRNYNIVESFEKFNLTNRETECLFYLVRGKTAKQMAAILSISFRTIEKHISNIKHKLNCTTKSDLIDKAIQHNFINYLPESIVFHSKTNISIIIP